MARLHLDKLGARLTRMSQEQADYIGVPWTALISRITTDINLCTLKYDQALLGRTK